MSVDGGCVTLERVLSIGSNHGSGRVEVRGGGALTVRTLAMGSLSNASGTAFGKLVIEGMGSRVDAIGPAITVLRVFAVAPDLGGAGRSGDGEIIVRDRGRLAVAQDETAVLGQDGSALLRIESGGHATFGNVDGPFALIDVSGAFVDPDTGQRTASRLEVSVLRLAASALPLPATVVADEISSLIVGDGAELVATHEIRALDANLAIDGGAQVQAGGLFVGAFRKNPIIVVSGVGTRVEVGQVGIFASDLLLLSGATITADGFADLLDSIIRGGNLVAPSGSRTSPWTVGRSRRKESLPPRR